MECGLGGETRIVEKFKLTPTCRGIDLLGLKVNREVEICNDFTSNQPRYLAGFFK